MIFNTNYVALTTLEGLISISEMHHTMISCSPKNDIQKKKMLKCSVMEIKILCNRDWNFSYDQIKAALIINRKSTWLHKLHFSWPNLSINRWHKQKKQTQINKISIHGDQNYENATYCWPLTLGKLGRLIK